MTPTLIGRLQTRVFLAITVGVVWTAIISLALPRPAGMPVGDVYRMTFQILAVMTVLGLAWELAYHLLQQLRWDKDWPSLVVLLTVINEAAPLWYVTHWLGVIPGAAGLSSPFLAPFAIHLGSTWLVMWLFMQGPLRVLHIRWRFEGGTVWNLAPGRWRRRSTHGDGSAPPAAVAGPAASFTARPDRTDLVEGVDCPHGHFTNTGTRYCLVCGSALAPLPDTTLGERPPLGILVLPDGATQVLDGDLRVVTYEDSGPLVFVPWGSRPDQPSAAEIKLVDWQPVIVSQVWPISATLPDGGTVQAARNVPMPLTPGTEFVLGGRRIRYESPYQPVAATALPAGKLGAARRAMALASRGQRRTVAAALVAAMLAGLFALGILAGLDPGDTRDPIGVPGIPVSPGSTSHDPTPTGGHTSAEPSDSAAPTTGTPGLLPPPVANPPLSPRPPRHTAPSRPPDSSPRSPKPTPPEPSPEPSDPSGLCPPGGLSLCMPWPW